LYIFRPRKVIAPAVMRNPISEFAFRIVLSPTVTGDRFFLRELLTTAEAVILFLDTLNEEGSSDI
jgi:hypothetical protein